MLVRNLLVARGTSCGRKQDSIYRIKCTTLTVLRRLTHALGVCTTAINHLKVTFIIGTNTISEIVTGNSLSWYSCSVE